VDGFDRFGCKTVAAVVYVHAQSAIVSIKAALLSRGTGLLPAGQLYHDQ
jgi:hypothetical protein